MRKITGLFLAFALFTPLSANAQIYYDPNDWWDPATTLNDIYDVSPWGWVTQPIPSSTFDSVVEEQLAEAEAAAAAIDEAEIAAAIAEYCEENPNDADC